MSALAIVAPGPLATVQDGGRQGFQRFGVSVSGALDAVALALANALAGNPCDMAAIELTLAGGSFAAADGPLRCALAGADMALTLDGAPLAAGRSHTLLPGQVLRIGGARRGARAYLAVAGGFAVPPVFGSRATHRLNGIGGLAGRALAAGDVLPLNLDRPAGPELGLAGPAAPSAPPQIRLVPGPQADYFTPAALAALTGAEYTVTAQSDRMGCRLAGPVLAHAKGFNIVSDAIAPGSVQVPGGGQPIVLLADRQTTGGYPKIATVITADLWRFGQLKPGDRVRFAAVELAEAQAARREMAEWLAALPARVRPLALDSQGLLGVNLISGVTDGEPL